MVKSVILAVAMCFACGYTALLLIGLLQGYVDIFAIALVTSLAIRPFKESIYANFLIYFTSSDSFLVLQGSFFFNPSTYIKSSVGSITSILISVLLSYLAYRTSLTFVGFLIVLIAFFDLSLRLLCMISLKFIKILKLNEFHEVFDIILTIVLMITLVALVLAFQTFAIGSVVIELTENGSWLYGWCLQHFDQEMIDSFELDTYFESVKLNITKLMGDYTIIYQMTNKKCSAVIQDSMNLPIVGKILFEFASNLDEILIPIELSTEHLVFLYMQVPDKLSILWKLISYVLKLLFSNIGGVAITISVIAERVILYFTLVYILIKDKKSILEKMLEALPINNTTKNEIQTEIVSTISGITRSFLLAAFAHYVVTLCLYYILELPFKHTFAVLSGIVGLFPFFGSWFVNLPMVVWLMIKWDLRGLILLLTEYFVVGYIDSFIYTAQLESYNPTLIGIVIVMGIYKFGTFGIFYGPLTICLVYLIFKLSQQLKKAETN